MFSTTSSLTTAAATFRSRIDRARVRGLTGKCSLLKVNAAFWIVDAAPQFDAAEVRASLESLQSQKATIDHVLDKATQLTFLAKEAEACGAYGENVKEPDQIAPALQRGLEQIRKGTPAVISVWLPKIMRND